MTNILKRWFSAIATMFANPGALLVFATLYALLLVASYIFISIREATIWQVLVTYALMILIPLGFFTLQAAIINRATAALAQSDLFHTAFCFMGRGFSTRNDSPVDCSRGW